MTNADEARELLAARRRVGFEPPVPASPAAVARIPLARVENIVARAVAKANEQFAARAGSTPPRAPWTGPSTSGADDLRKAAPHREAVRRADAAEGARLGKVAGERLAALAAAAAKRREELAKRQASVPARAIVDAYDEADRLRDLHKTTPDFLPVTRVRDAEQRAAFVTSLAEVTAAPLYKADGGSTMTPPTPEEAAAAASDPAWSERLRDQAVAAEIRRVRPRRLA